MPRSLKPNPAVDRTPRGIAVRLLQAAATTWYRAHGRDAVYHHLFEAWNSILIKEDANFETALFHLIALDARTNGFTGSPAFASIADDVRKAQDLIAPLSGVDITVRPKASDTVALKGGVS